jgi:NAD(P)-dependent dehydrogenase (short-subunit alcohol dehydrogenase family)
MSLANGFKARFDYSARMNFIILGISSDIGLALAKHWALQGNDIFGTYRTLSVELVEVASDFKGIYACDLLDSHSIDRCAGELKAAGVTWDVMVIAPGTMEPIGRFDVCDIDRWCDGIAVNLTAPIRFLHNSMTFRRQGSQGSSVLFFAGGGSNSAPVNVSSYTISKIALIKATELLDAEFDDIKFSIVGPGWVRTKIHEETLRAENVSPASLDETKRRLVTDSFNPMEDVVACCDWLISTPKSVVGGRNFSSVHDNWGSATLNEKLSCNRDMYKLRRYENN